MTPAPAGWEPGYPLLGVWRYRRPLEDAPGWLQVALVPEVRLFILSRVVDDRHAVPSFADMARVESDFAVAAWSILGVQSAIAPASGQCLVAQAVEKEPAS